MRRILKILLLTAAFVLVPLRGIATFAAVTDADIWLRLRTGEWIAQNHAFPHTGLFTQHTELPWLAYSWGFDLLSYFAARMLGGSLLANMTMFLILLQVVLAAVLFAGLQRTSRSFTCSALLTAGVLYASNMTPPRSLIISMMFFVVELAVVFASQRDGATRRLWWLALLFVFWANIHIQFVYGLMALGILAVAMTVEHWLASRGVCEAPKIRWTTAWGVLAACTAATCVNPYFVSIYRTIFSYAGNTAQYQQVMEYAAMSFRRPQHYALLVLVLVACFVVGRRRRVDVFRMLLLACVTVFAFRAQRDAWFACITAGFVLAEAWRRDEDSQETARTLLYSTAAAFALAVCIATGYAVHVGLDSRTLATQVAKQYPVRAAAFIQQQHLPGPLYNTYNWGEYLVFNLRDYPVSIDGRTDLFGPAMDTRAMATVNAYDIEHDADFQRANVILLEKFLPLTDYLSRAPGYRLVYADDVAAVYVRSR